VQTEKFNYEFLQYKSIDFQHKRVYFLKLKRRFVKALTKKSLN